MARNQRGPQRGGVYEQTPFLNALNPNVGFVESPGSTPYNLGNIRADRAARRSGGANQLSEFGTGSERGSNPNAGKGGGRLPHEGMLAFANDAANAGKAAQDAASKGGGPTGDRSSGNSLWDADWAFKNPDQGVLNWLESMGYYIDDLELDPFSSFMQDISAGLPYLYRFSGMPGATGTANFGDYLEQYTNAMLNTPAGATNYSGNALYDWNELQALVGMLASGQAPENLSGEPAAAYGMLKDLPAQEAMSALMGMLAASSSTAMTPIDFNIISREIQRGWNQYQRQNTTPRKEGAEGSAFWDYLMQSGVLNQFF